MIHKTKISLNLSGLVLFDPVVLNEFVLFHNIDSSNLLDVFIQQPDIGNKAISQGVLLPIYSIEPWDYSIVINKKENSQINTEWVLFETKIEFPLKIKSGCIIVSDIYAILTWNPDYYLNFPDKEERVGVDDDFTMPVGDYAVKVLGFRDKNNKDIENRECGYEFFFRTTEKMPNISNVEIDDFNFNVNGAVNDSL